MKGSKQALHSDDIIGRYWKDILKIFSVSPNLPNQTHKQTQSFACNVNSNKELCDVIFKVVDLIGYDCFL